MQPKVVWSARAERVLTDVDAYLREKYGDDYADRYLDSVQRATSGLAQYPTKARPVPGKHGSRRWELDAHYYIVYEPTDYGIKVTAMLSIKRGQ